MPEREPVHRRSARSHPTPLPTAPAAARDWRRFARLPVVIALVFVAVAAIAIVQRDAVRRVVAESIDADFKNSLISDYSLLTSEPHETADFVPVANTDTNPYGINVFFEQEVEESKIRQSMQIIKAAGFGWIKQQVVWSEIETPAKGMYGLHDDTWDKYDRIVRLAHEYGLEVVFRIDTCPVWARPNEHLTKLETPPANNNDYGDFVSAVVSRYKGQVRYYQIWNEPNLSFEWGGEYPSPSGYVALLRNAYFRAKTADPSSVILAAALAPTIEMTERGLADVYYLNAMYEAGARGSFDIMSVNAYGLRHGPDDYRLDSEKDVNFSRPILVREEMVRNGDAEKPIWAAEVGWNALPPNFGEEPRYGTVTRDQQARYTVRAYQRAQSDWPWLGGMALWHFRMVNPRDVIQQQYYFNSVDEQFQPYPIYDQMKALATSVGDVGRGFHQESHWAARRSAGWQVVADPRASLGQQIVTADPAQEYRVRFSGTNLDLVVPRGPSSGALLVTVDGQAALANELPVGTSGARLDLAASTDEWQVRVPVARALSDGTHELVVRPEPGGRVVGIDGFVVDGPTPRDRMVRRVVAWLMVIVAGACWFGTDIIARLRRASAVKRGD